jgi:hypothetical protein
MAIAGKKIGAMRVRGCIDDGVRRRQLVSSTKIGGRQRNRSIEIGNIASLGEGNYLISLILAGVSREPFCQFELDDGRDEPLLTRWQLARYRLA